MSRSLLARVGLVAVVLVAVATPLTAPAQGRTPDATAGPGSGPDVDFAGRAMRLCTTAMNAHMAEPADLDPVAVFLEVVTRDRQGGAAPSPEESAAWAGALRAEVDRLSEIRAALAGLHAADPAQQAAWAEIVGAGDARMVELERRRDALLAGDWDATVAAFRDVRGTADGPSEGSLARLGLERTDCQFAFAAHRPEAGPAGFQAAAAEACTTIAARRLADDFDGASQVAIEALAAVLREGPEGLSEDLLPRLDFAHASLIDEWRATTSDLSAVDPAGAPDAHAWDDAVAYGEARAAVLEGRRRPRVGADGAAGRLPPGGMDLHQVDDRDAGAG